VDFENAPRVLHLAVNAIGANSFYSPQERRLLVALEQTTYTEYGKHRIHGTVLLQCSVHRSRKQLFSAHYHYPTHSQPMLGPLCSKLTAEEEETREEGRECHVLDMLDVSEPSSSPFCPHSFLRSMYRPWILPLLFLDTRFDEPEVLDALIPPEN
jgi:hypothetical protein